jgi:hypothetical protein
MLGKYISVAIFSLFLISLSIAVPAEPDRGERLVNESCHRCHDNSIFTRPDSIIFSFSALKKRVHFCESMAHAGWSEQDYEAVVDYLNRNFYHFKH